jgi:ribosomal protein S2
MALAIDVGKLANVTTKDIGGVTSAPVTQKSSIGELVQKELNNLQVAEKQLQDAIGGASRMGAASMRDLLVIQNQASRFHLKVEVASRVAEAAASSIRRLQQG